MTYLLVLSTSILFQDQHHADVLISAEVDPMPIQPSFVFRDAVITFWSTRGFKLCFNKGLSMGKTKSKGLL